LQVEVGIDSGSPLTYGVDVPSDVFPFVAGLKEALESALGVAIWGLTGVPAPNRLLLLPLADGKQ